MKTWIKLLAMVALMLGLAVADDVVAQTCEIDADGYTKTDPLDSAAPKSLACVKNIITDEMKDEFTDAKALADVQRLTSGFCSHASQVVTCLATLKASYETCHNKNVSVPVMIYFDLLEHLLPGACENEGEPLAYLLHGWQLVSNSKNSMIPLKTCVSKVSSPLLITLEDLDIDIVSQSYLAYKDLTKLTACVTHIEDEAYKQAIQSLRNMLLSTLKCQHPEEDRLVLCSDVDVSKVTTTSICGTKPLNIPDLYEFLEEKAIHCNCDRLLFATHETDNNSSISLDELKGNYETVCTRLKDVPNCLLLLTAIAEECLNQEEGKEFQLFAQSIKDLIERSCVEEGVWMATVMLEVHRQLPEHGHALRDCYQAGEEARLSNQGDAHVSKNMRFYHDMIGYKQCVVEKLHANNDVSKGMENMINDVLKKMKCVSPEDGNAVLCENIHRD